MSGAELDTVDRRPGIFKIIASASDRLADAGVPSPRTDAELLAAHVLGVPRGGLWTAGAMPPDTQARYHELIAARARRVPLQHLTGTAAFRHVDIAVGPGVFVPRPETELLVELALDRLRGHVDPHPVVVDLCSGSGAVALAVANELPGARVYAVEAEPEATGWLRRNAAVRRAAGDPPVTVIEADVTGPGALRSIMDAIPVPWRGSTADGGGSAAPGGACDAVLCNPPYVPDGSPVAPEVREHDPAAAVFAGPDGLAVIRAVVPLAAGLLRPAGVFAVEHDESHQEAVLALLGADGRFTGATGHRDLTGRPRVATARRV